MPSVGQGPITHFLGSSSTKQRQIVSRTVLHAIAEAGGGGINDGKGHNGSGGGNSGGGGGNGDAHSMGDENRDHGNSGLLQMLGRAWYSRVEADPEFAFKLFVECFNDACIIIAVNLAQKKDRFLKELEFVLCHISVSLLNDASLVWLLAPIATQAQAQGGTAGKGLGRLLASLPQHCFQKGSFSLAQRMGCFAYKGALYGVIGAAMGILGTLAADPSYVPPATEQPVLKAGLAWLIFMSCSSNTRYQAVNGMERLLYGALPSGPARIVTVGMRLGNNFLGSMNFVALAKALELQQPRQVKAQVAVAGGTEQAPSGNLLMSKVNRS
eukprot:jgi/Mesen1/3861/ME000207S02875